MEAAPLHSVLQLLRKYNLKDTEELLKKEANLSDLNLPPPTTDSQPEADINKALNSYRTDGDPFSYSFAYDCLKKFIEGSLDMYKHELSTLLYPVLVHLYLEMLKNGYNEHAKRLLERYGPEQEEYYQEDISKFALITNQSQLEQNEMAKVFLSNNYVVQISRDTSSQLKRFLHEQKNSNLLTSIVNNRLQLEPYEGTSRTRSQIATTAGGLMGEAPRAENRMRVYYGLLKEPDISVALLNDEEEEAEEASDKHIIKKKKSKKDPSFSKKAKSDPNAPSVDRMPLPDLKETEKIEKSKALREASKRVPLGPDSLPSICFYTVLNAAHAVTCAEVAEDSSMLAVGFADSHVRVWSLTPNKLRALKSADRLAEVDREAVDVQARMMDERAGETSRRLLGHAGPVYRAAFDAHRTLLLTCAEDGCVRLWSLHAWKCLVCYRGHVFPVWDVRFAPHGHYFATASHDRTARLWVTDSYAPLRVYVGHWADVDCVQFHPNSNYIATGSSDRTVRLWDCVNGNQVRIMTGHKSSISSIAFSICGRFVASGCMTGQILIWDLSQGHLVAEFKNHSASVHSLAFSRDGTLLSSGSLDCTLKLWDFNALAEEMANEENNGAHNPDVKTGDKYFLRSYATKNSPIVTLHFTRRNLLLAVGTYEGS